MISKNTICRDCGSTKLHMFIDLTDQAPANAFLRPEQIADERAYPLRAYVCEDCQLVQLTDIVDIDELFQNYVYLTAGAGPTTPKHFTDYAQSVVQTFSLNEESLVVELGSNDGLLLSAFQNAGVTHVVGVDPAKNVAEIANERGVPTIAAPWGKEVALKIKKNEGLADVIIGNNVVAHIEDHKGLMAGVVTLLKEDGVFIFEAPYLMDMFERLAFDTIYHEHLACLSLRPIKRLVEKFGMEVFDMHLTPAQGVSMRVFIGKKGAHTILASVSEFEEKELSLHLDEVKTYHELAERITNRKNELLELLQDLKKQGKRIAGYGAPAKGNTLLNYGKIGPEILDYLTEELPSKVGLLSPGMHIPVVHVNDARNNPPDYFLMLAWNYSEKILENEAELRAKGVKFIIPIGEKIQIV